MTIFDFTGYFRLKRILWIQTLMKVNKRDRGFKLLKRTINLHSLKGITLPVIFISIFFLLFLATFFTLPANIYASKNNFSNKKKIIVFHAGSLSLPFMLIEKNYEKLHPDIDIQREAAGSLVCARKITELNKQCDIFASADYRIIDRMLIPSYSDWNILFASNRMVICYTDNSRYSERINSSNWYRILSREDTSWGISDPNLDPCGYRALISIKLAERFYKITGLYDTLLSSLDKKNIRPKSVDLISLLQTGNLDYAWEYYSVAVQHGLKFLDLPDDVNLGNYKKNHIYRKTEIRVSEGMSNNNQKFKFYRGEAITYGLTVLKSSLNKREVVDFVKFILQKRDGGLDILKRSGQLVITPPVLEKNIDTEVPGWLNELVYVKPDK